MIFRHKIGQTEDLRLCTEQVKITDSDGDSLHEFKIITPRFIKFSQ